ncbi:MAG: sigma-70 family RNA polymerase sigma factor [Candidatus Cloacimonetes bacterium]|jgi:RNA polymerase sigma factor (sigma-70 family)|nr:sigma-70 family RNA polymerase sigma factor [Candidatus Cloacimonadota bacterium]
MKFNDKKLTEYQKLAFNYALYRVGNFEAANDIASQTISLFLLSFEKTQNNNAKGWIINTVKNYCKKYFYLKQKENQKKNSYRENLIQELDILNSHEYDESLKEAFQESFKALNDQELRIILYFFQCNENIKEMYNVINGSYPALRKQISRIKRKLKAETFRRLGIIGTKKIVTPQLNDVIIKFLQRFKENLENNTLEKMYYYFSEVDLKHYNPSYEIKNILDYDIDLIDSVYKVWVIYKNKEDIGDSFYIEFFVDSKNHLKIITPPTKPKKLIKIASDSEEGQKILTLLKNSPIDKKTGRPKFSSEELEKILQQIEDKETER